MAECVLAIDFFGEDEGHALFFRELAFRLAREVGLAPPEIRTGSARGGHGRAITELKGWQKARHGDQGDPLAVMIDANDVGWHEQRRAVDAAVMKGRYPAHVIGCPDPEIEAWLVADPATLSRVFGVSLPSQLARPGADFKLLLRAALRDAGVPVLGDVTQVALDIVPIMDLHAAGRRSSSLGHFADELRAAFRRLLDS